MEIISPECIQPFLAPVVSACKLSCHPPHKSADLHPLLRIQKQVHVIAGDAVVQQRHFKLPQVLTQLGPVAVPVQCEFEQELPIVAPVCHMEYSSVSAQPISPSHEGILSPAGQPLQAENRAQNRP